MATAWKLSVRAYAKINRSLAVTGRRADGYHQLRTVFQALALADRLEFAPRSGSLLITCTDPAVPADQRNLVWKAAQALWTASGREGKPQGIEIRLTKRIPAQGGLGGGSADAAATLAALAPVWGVRTDGDRLAELAARVGADVPFFLVGGTALGLGRGDEIHPLRDRARRWVALVMPPFGVSTVQAFQWLDEQRAGHAADRTTGCGEPAEGSGPVEVEAGAAAGEPISPPPPAGVVSDAAAEIAEPEPADGVNDLEGPVVARFPVIGSLIAGLRAEGAEVAAMTGSGSTVYGIFATSAEAEAAARRLPTPEGCRVVVTRTASSAECRRMLRLPSVGTAGRP